MGMNGDLPIHLGLMTFWADKVSVGVQLAKDLASGNSTWWKNNGTSPMCIV